MAYDIYYQCRVNVFGNSHEPAYGGKEQERQALRIVELLIALAVATVLGVGMGALKKYLRRLSTELCKKQKDRKK